MPDFLFPESTTMGQTGLTVLMVVIALLFIGTVALSVYAVVMRWVHVAQDEEKRRLTERWRDPVLSAVADPSLVPSVQELVGEDDAVHFMSFVIEYARRVRGEEKATLRSLVKPFLPELKRRLHAHGTEMRAWGVQMLGTLGLPEHADEVIAALDDPSPLVAMVAARALSRSETPQYAPEVLARLDRFSGWNRLFLASMLASMGPTVSEALRDGLADDSRAPSTRAVMAEALRLQGDFGSGDVAARVVETAGDRELRASALRLLRAVGRPEHASVVRPLCSSDDAVVRAQALRALGALGGREDVPGLIEAMEDPSPWPALYAARGARDAGGSDVLRGLVASGEQRATLAEQVLGEDGAR